MKYLQGVSRYVGPIAAAAFGILISWLAGGWLVALLFVPLACMFAYSFRTFPAARFVKENQYLVSSAQASLLMPEQAVETDLTIHNVPETAKPPQAAEDRMLDLVLPKVGEMTRHIETATSAMLDSVTDVEQRAEAIAQSSYEIRTRLDGQSVKNAETLAQSEEVQRQFDETAAALEENRQKSEAWLGQMVQSAAALGAVLKDMQDIREISGTTRQSFEEFREEFRQIRRIFAQIKEVADQTQLLSLNAAIEAAHAGQYGAGFSVVASAIRQLSEETKTLSAESARHIQSLLAKADSASTSVATQVSLLHESEERTSGMENLLNQLTDSMSDLSGDQERMQVSLSALELGYAELKARLQELGAMSEQTSAEADMSAEASQIQLVALMEASSSVDILSGVASQLREVLAQAGYDPQSMKWVRPFHIAS